MIRVRVLGAVEVSIGHRKIGMNTEILFACAVYLTARAGERIPREDLLTFFWSKGTVAERRHALRQLLYRLRQKGAELDEDGEWVRLDTALSDSDLRHALDASWIEKATAAEIDAAANFLPVFSRRMAPGFVTWLDGVREQLSAQHRKAAQRQITQARREGRWSDLERWALAVLKSDPLNEEATMARAESAAMGGSKVIAMEILDTYLSEVGDISPELGRPALALRKRLAERRPDWGFRGPKEVALVGRTDLMSRLTGLVEAAWRGEGSAVVLVGAPGIGKTRLALETRAYAELKGMRTVVVRAEAGNAERPLAVVMSLVPQLIQLPGAAGSDPSALEVLRRIARSQSKGDESVNLGHDSLRDTILAALEEVMSAVAVEAKLLVLIDDVHNIDVESLPILAALSRRTLGRRVAWIATSRDAGPEPRYRQLQSGSYCVYRVLPLEPAESCLLVEAVLDAHRLNLSSPAILEIARVSGGNPLFVRELGAHRASTGDDASTPQTLKDLMSDRIGRLDDGVIRLLRIISLLESCATVSRVRALAGQDIEHFSAVVDGLETEGLLTMGDRHLVLHESWRQHVYAGLRGATRALLSHECAEALVRVATSGSMEEHWRAAELYAVAGESAESIRFFVRAADEMLTLGLPEEASGVLTRAMAECSTNEQRLAIKRRLAEAHHARGDLQNVIVSTNHLHDISWRGLPQHSLTDLVVATCHRSDALAKSHLPLAHELAWLERVSSNTSVSADARQFACYTGIRRAFFAENRGLAEQFYTASRSLADQYGASLTSELVNLVRSAELGDVADVIAANNSLARMNFDAEPLTLHCNSLRYRSHALKMAGELLAALEVGTQAYEVSLRFRQTEIAVNAAESLTFLCLDLEDLDGSALWLDRWYMHSGDRVHPMRDQGLQHAQLRLLVQRGEYAIAHEELSARLPAMRADSMVSRRAGEMLTAAFAAAMVGEKDLARSIVDEIEPTISSHPAEFLLDYPSEMLARTLRLLGDFESSNRFLAAYSLRRRHSFARPLAPFYQELRAVWNTDANERSRS